jgi:hypothetical protein
LVDSFHLPILRKVSDNSSKLKLKKRSYDEIETGQVGRVGVVPEVCKSWLSLALTAKSTFKEVKLWDVQGGVCFTGGTMLIEKLSIAEN